MTELSEISKGSKFNQVYPLQKPDYSRDVTEASNEAYVLVNMTSSSGTNTESRIVTECWRQLALRFGDIKFCEIQASLCIEGYPEQNTPTILIYRHGDIKRQLITLKDLRGEQTTLQGGCCAVLQVMYANAAVDLQKLLVTVGAVRENDHRILRLSHDENETSKFTGANEEEDDWD